MIKEIEAAAKWWTGLLSESTRNRAVLYSFCHTLRELLIKQFQGNWFECDPERGSALRCVCVDSGIDLVLEQALLKAGLKNPIKYFSHARYTIMWINPGKVHVGSMVKPHQTTHIVYCASNSTATTSPSSTDSASAATSCTSSSGAGSSPATTAPSPVPSCSSISSDDPSEWVDDAAVYSPLQSPVQSPLQPTRFFAQCSRMSLWLGAGSAVPSSPSASSSTSMPSSPSSGPSTSAWTSSHPTLTLA